MELAYTHLHLTQSLSPCLYISTSYTHMHTRVLCIYSLTVVIATAGYFISTADHDNLTVTKSCKIWGISERGILICLHVSRDLRVTVSLFADVASVVSKSTVTANGMPTSSARAYLRPMLVPICTMIQYWKHIYRHT